MVKNQLKLSRQLYCHNKKYGNYRARWLRVLSNKSTRVLVFPMSLLIQR